MSKIITKEELIALYNEIESLRLKVKNEIETEITKENNIFDYDEILSAVKMRYKSINAEIIEWIFGKRKFTEISEHLQEKALIILFEGAFRYENLGKRFTTIQGFLKATEDPMFIEIAEKLKIFQEKERRMDQQKIKTGVMLLNHFDSKEKIDTSYEYHYRTIKSESKQITKSQKKASKDEQAKIRKFRNIYNINQRDLYHQIIQFLMEHDYYPYELYDVNERTNYSLQHIEKIVYENQRKAIKMLSELKYLQFAFEQKKGKIR